MRWEDEDRVGAHFVLPGSGTWHPVVKLGDRVLRAPPVTLPYAPEFEPGSRREGKTLLAEVAKAGGGVERLAMAGLFAEAAESEAKVPLAPWLVGCSVLVLLAEVFVRRFTSGQPRRQARQASGGGRDGGCEGRRLAPAQRARAVPHPADAARQRGASRSGGRRATGSGREAGGEERASAGPRAGEEAHRPLRPRRLRSTRMWPHLAWPIGAGTC